MATEGMDEGATSLSGSGRKRAEPRDDAESREQLDLLAPEPASKKPSATRTRKRSARRSKSKQGPLPESAVRGVEGPLDLGTDKLYFKIGEVAEIVGVPPYVLRYWETEFKAIRPQKSRSQLRVYRRRHVETLLRIKFLLYGRKYTIAGARQVLREQGAELTMAAPAGAYLARRSFSAVRSAFRDLLAELALDENAETAADPSAYIRSMGGARAIFTGADETGDAQPLLGRDARGPR